MTTLTQQEFTERAKKNVAHYNSFYSETSTYQLEFYSCDVEKRQLELTHPVYPSELNIYGMLHGGAIAWLADSCAGILTRSYTGIKACVTTNLNINYIRSIGSEDPAIIRATLSNVGRTMVFATIDIRNAETDQLYCTASATFFKVSE